MVAPVSNHCACLKESLIVPSWSSLQKLIVSGIPYVTMKQAWKPIVVCLLCLGMITAGVLIFEALFK